MYTYLCTLINTYGMYTYGIFTYDIYTSGIFTYDMYTSGMYTSGSSSWKTLVYPI